MEGDTARAEIASIIDELRAVGTNSVGASTSSLAGRVLERAADVLDAIDFTPAAIRNDLDGPRRSPRLLHSAVELIDHTADRLSDSAGLVHDNERRWRTFHQLVIEVA